MLIIYGCFYVAGAMLNALRAFSQELWVLLFVYTDEETEAKRS